MSSYAVVGDANTGKSTLLSALTFGANAVLPSAGVGPVTGTPVRLRYALSPSVAFRYASTQRLYELAFAVEHLHARAGGRAVRNRDYEGKLPPSVVHAHVAGLVRSTHVTSVEQLLRLARLLAFGAVDANVPSSSVRAGMRALLGLKPIPELPAVTPDPLVSFRIKQLLRSASEDREVSAALDIDDPGSRARIADHVSGALSVLTDEIVIGWPARLLEGGLELVDLPGVGVAFDAFESVTARHLSESSDGLLIVCGRGGISEASQRLLCSSGALARRLAEWDPDRPSIVVVVTKLDGEAEQLRRQEAPARRRPTVDYFRHLSREVAPVLRAQFVRLIRLTAGTPSTSPASVAATVPVIAVAAPSYMGLLAQDLELSTFFRSVDDTNVPALARLLTHHSPTSTLTTADRQITTSARV